MNIQKLLHDHNIPHAQPGESNYREGWVNVRCPFCSDHSNHLGFNIQQGYAHCWRCGGHWIDKAVARVLNIPVSKAKQLLKEYGGRPVKKVEEVKRKIRTKAHRLPSDTGKMKVRHKKYLLGRNFDPDYIETQWGVLGTGPIAKLDKVDYKHRLLAPIYWDGEQVSFQTRDITGKHPAKYKACPEDRELIKHKHILYGQQSKWTKTGICVEGITDVWRLGPISFATFGISWTQPQVRVIAKTFNRVIILFDQEPQAQYQAKKLQAELQVREIEAFIETIEGDPGELSENQARELIKKVY